MKKLLFFATAALIMSACSNSGNKTQAVEPAAVQNEIVITNDMENAMGMIPGWLNENTVIAMNEPQAHSGSFSGITNDTMPYGYTYKVALKNLDTRVPKMVTMTGWIYTTAANADFSIICGISENEQTYNWKAYPLNNVLGETGKWTEFTASFYFDDKPLKSEHEISLYGWNKSKSSVFTDDLKITFVY